MTYYSVVNDVLNASSQPPTDGLLIVRGVKLLTPPLVTQLHRQMQAWAKAGFSPGPIEPQRVWINGQGALALAYDGDVRPRPITDHIGLAPDLAAWFVLLDKWMETYVVIARARTVWSVAELGAALPFISPVYLPPALVDYPPNNWMRTARALATGIADGPLDGSSQDRYWQSHSA